MNKRGISAVVATVLIIIIALASIVIVWVGVLPLIKQSISFEESASLSIDTSQGYTFYDVQKKYASIQIKRSSESITPIDGIEVVFTTQGKSSVYRLQEEDIVQVNQERVIAFMFLGMNFETPDTVAVVPLFRKGTSIKRGEITSEVEIVKEVAQKESIPSTVYYKEDCNHYDTNDNDTLEWDEIMKMGKNWGRTDCDVSNDWCEGYDFNRDGNVNLGDVGIFAGNNERTDCESPGWCNNVDINKDGSVDLYDFGDSGYVKILENAKCVP